MVLLAVAVAAAVGAASAVDAVAPAADRATFGAAAYRFTLDDAHPAAVDATIDAALAWFDDVEVIRRGHIDVEGRGDPIEVRVQDPAAPLGARMLALRHGRHPLALDELAVAENLARDLGVGVGSVLTVDNGVEMRVVGLVENPSALSDGFILASQQFGTGSPSVTLLVDADAHRAQSFRGTGDPVPVFTGRGDGTGLTLVAVVTMTEVALVLVSLLAATGFVVTAQRRQRQLGMLAAIGATEAHLRLVTLSHGALVGIVGSVTGAAAGLVTWFATAPLIGQRAGTRVERFGVPWWLVGLIVVLAMAMTTVAAWWPARITARVPITTALAGRRPQSQPARRSIAASTGLIGAGLAALAVAGDVTSPRRDGVAIHNGFLVATGTTAIVAGVLLVSPAAIRLVGGHVRAFVLPARVALRDLARYQSRSAAALGAISLALGIPLAVTFAAASAEHGPDTGNLSSRQILIATEDLAAPLVAVRTETERQSLDRQVHDIAARLPGSRVTELRKVLDPRLDVSPFGAETIRIDSEASDGDGPAVFLASDEIIDALDISPPPGFELLTAQTGRISYGGAVDPRTGMHPPQPITDVAIIDLDYSSLPSSLLSPDEVVRRGWTSTTAGWLIETPESLTDAQITDIRSMTLSAGLDMERRDDQASLVQLRNGATVVGIVLALGILALTVGLLRGEAVQDLQTLTATGATSSIRRAITAGTAVGLAAPGVIIATISAYAAIAAASTDLPPVPVANLAALALGVPVLACLAAWIAAGHEPATLTRHVIE